MDKDSTIATLRELGTVDLPGDLRVCATASPPLPHVASKLMAVAADEIARLTAIEERAKESYIDCDEWMVEGHILFGKEYDERF